MKTIIFCTDCRYYKPFFTVDVDYKAKYISRPEDAICLHRDFRSLVDGSYVMRCEIARLSKNLCGQDAKKFSPKPPKNVENIEPDFEVIDDRLQ